MSGHPIDIILGTTLVVAGFIWGIESLITWAVARRKERA